MSYPKILTGFLENSWFSDANTTRVHFLKKSASDYTELLILTGLGVFT